MSTKHTPGPWQVERNNTFRDTFIGPVMGGQRIAECFARMEGEEKTIANARLISAAPELLEALEALLQNAENKAVYISMLEHKECFDSEGNAIAEYSPEMDKARAAIAKAKGQL